jgi:hypothetical protein
MNSSAILFLALVANGACQKAETAEAAAAATTISEEQLIEGKSCELFFNAFNIYIQ